MGEHIQKVGCIVINNPEELMRVISYYKEYNVVNQNCWTFAADVLCIACERSTPTLKALPTHFTGRSSLDSHGVSLLRSIDSSDGTSAGCDSYSDSDSNSAGETGSTPIEPPTLMHQRCDRL